MSGFLIVLAILGIAFILVTRYPNATEAWFMRILKIRRVGFAVFGIILAAVLLSSGVLFLQIFGGAILLYAILTLLFDPSLEEMRQMLSGLPVVGGVFN